ncbi:acyl-CoA N-acyltransferases (NAT) superfamily protein [Actinidia rufa]|uniref:Acyl-CoA N-acyltransferases (NAT) superfamily protein n=1 Tax=Actinidia rufa TaxID=165716 RepID=A0A7J0H6U8_9ERIC|nr:acyl-CoA N-acyltransferases (NAT) superfamily protein [Actinidia rufa]
MVEEGAAALVVREFDEANDTAAVEEVERLCEVGPTGKLSLFTDLLGDPICRVRHSPAFLMLVAERVMEGEEEREIVGMIRGCIKTVTCGKKLSRSVKSSHDPTKPVPVYAKLAYMLGLRVSPSHRRMGIGLTLVRRIEEWFRENGAEYSYMATENDNEPSVKLFTDKCGYSRFRTPSILVNPVFAHRVRLSSRVTILKLTPSDAESLYRFRFSTTEFFPRDIDSVLYNKLNLGTFVAVPGGSYSAGSWPGSDRFLVDPPESWAVLSVWNCKEVFKLEVRGASRVRRGIAKTTRLVDRALPWLGLPSVPEVFRPFGLHFLYGLGGDGPKAAQYVKALCVGLRITWRKRVGVGWWRRRFQVTSRSGDWTKSPPGLSIFVDPREF